MTSTPSDSLQLMTASLKDPFVRTCPAGHVRTNGSFKEAVMSWSESEGVDVILDPVGAGYLSDNLDSLRLGGRPPSETQRV